MASSVSLPISQGPSRPAARESYQNLSRWQIYKLVANHMLAKGTLWGTVALAVGAVALSVLTVGIAISSLRHIADIQDKLAQGGWARVTYQSGALYGEATPLSNTHLVGAYAGLLLGVPMIALMPFLFWGAVSNNIKKAYSEVIRA